MKKIFFFFLLCAVVACSKKSDKDTGSTQKEPYLSREVYKGLTATRFYYNSDKRLSKMESYNADPANNVANSCVTFGYDDMGRCVQVNGYMMPGDIPVQKIIRKFNEKGQLLNAETYDLQGPSPNSPVYFFSYFYNASGRMIKRTEKNKDGKLLENINMTYFPDGHLKESLHYRENAGKLYLSYRISYAAPGGDFPPGLKALRSIEGINFLSDMFYESANTTNYTPAGAVTYSATRLYSGREYNSDGTLKKQVLTLKYIKPESDDFIATKEYEYVEL